MSGYLLDKESVRILKEIVREYKRGTSPYRGQRKQFIKPGPSIRLAKTTAEHVINTTQDVDIYAGPINGGESATGETYPAFNRFKTVPADRWCYVIFTGTSWDMIAADPCTSEEE